MSTKQVTFKFFHQPKAHQIREALRRADESFTACTSDGFDADLPQIEINGVKYASDQSPILLGMKNVEPHSDPWVGNSNIEPPEDERLAAFWVIKLPALADMKFWCEGLESSIHIMRAGELIVFNDSQLHLVMSLKKWYGAAWQLKKV